MDEIFQLGAVHASSSAADFPPRSSGMPTRPVLRLLTRIPRPRRRHRHPGHSGHHHRRCRCHGRRQGGVGAATGHHQQSRWKSSADEWHHFNGKLSCKLDGRLCRSAIHHDPRCTCSFWQIVGSWLWRPSKCSASAPSHLLADRLSRSQTPCSLSMSSLRYRLVLGALSVGSPGRPGRQLIAADLLRTRMCRRLCDPSQTALS